MPYIIIGVIVVILIIWVITTYNSFVTLIERVDNAKSQIAIQIESRWDAVSSLINATKKYSSHEADTLEKVTAQRTSINSNSSVQDIEDSEQQLNQVVGRLIAVSEAYPDLKASTVYQETMQSINKFENNVRQSRMIYNDTVTMYNRRIRMFPSSIIAKIFNFTSRRYFEGTEAKQEMPSWE